MYYVQTGRSGSESCLVAVQHVSDTHLRLLRFSLTANHVFLVEEVAKAL